MRSNAAACGFLATEVFATKIIRPFSRASPPTARHTYNYNVENSQANYLFYISAALNPETSVIAAIIIGATVGFLVFNLHPAKIFMGDTGSLFLGAMVTACSFNIGNPLLIIFIAGVYVIEGLSVVLQVSYFKLTRKRISDQRKNPLTISSSASFSVSPRVISLMSCSPAIFPIAAS